MAKVDVATIAKKYGCLVSLNDIAPNANNRDPHVTEPIRKVLEMVKNLRKKLVNILQTMQSFETEHFWVDLARSNLLTFLYSHGDALSAEDEEDTGLLKQIGKTLEKDPRNITALVMQMKVYSNRGKKLEAKKIKAQLKELEGDENETIVQSITCDSEAAFAYSYVHPTLYRRAVEKYEAVIDRYERVSKHNPIVRERLRCQSHGWYYQLATMYSRGLNKGITQLMYNGSPCVIELYRKICDGFKHVIDTEDETPFRGRAMIQIVEAFRKCSTLIREGSIAFPYDDTPDSFVERAYALSPKDPFVVERYAEQYRQRAYNEETFLRAVSLFDKVLELHPNRHYALIHKGRAHKSLWLETGHYKEAKLHRNSQRKGKPSHQEHASRAGSNPHKSKRPTKAYSTLARHFTKSLSVQHEAAENNVQLSPMPQTAPPSFPTIAPTFPTTFGKAHEQRRQPDFFDTLRVSNPGVDDRDTKSKKHLLAAEDCFKKACELTHNVSCSYLTELGRVFISLGRNEEALSKFETAKNLSAVDDNDAAYLHEQLAMLRQQMLDKSAPDYTAQLEDVMALYREAIRAAMAAKTRSKMAFYKLRDILQMQLERNPGNKAFSMEYEVLYNTIDRHYTCKTDVLIEALRQDADTCQTAIWLVQLLVERNLKNDASIAFVYITALQKAGKLGVENEDEKERNDLRSAAVKIAREMNNRDRPAQHDAPNDSFPLGQVFRWLTGDETLSSVGLISSYHSKEVQFDLCILASSDDSPVVASLIDLLENHLSLKLCTAFFEGGGDMTLGRFVVEDALSLISRSVCVFVVDDRQHDQWSVVEAILRILLGKSIKSNVFLVSDAALGTPSDCLYSVVWPRLRINGEKSSNCLACELLETCVSLSSFVK